MSVLKPYLLLNFSNYGIGFIVSVLFTFSYTGIATEIVITKQILSSLLCLLFVTLPLERALVRDSRNFQPTYSPAQVAFGIVALMGCSVWVGLSTSNWLLTAALNITGSLATLSVAVLSTHLMGKERFTASVALTMFSRIMDFLPITLLEYRPDAEAVALLYYSVCAAFFSTLAHRSVSFKRRRQYLESYEALRIVAMLMELLLANYLLAHSGHFKSLMFVNTLSTIVITLGCIPIWKKVSVGKWILVVCGVVASLISLTHPLVGLIAGRLTSFFTGIVSLTLSLTVPACVWVGYWSTRGLIEFSDAVAISVFSLITSIIGKSLSLMKKTTTQ